MAYEQTVNVVFNSGNYSSTTKDANGFWLTIGEYTSSADIEKNESTVDITNLILNHTNANMFSNWTLRVYLRAEYVLNNSGTTSYKYFFGTSTGTSIGQKSMTSTTLSLLTSAQIAPVIIPHNDDGTRPYVRFAAFCDATTDASYVPKDTTATHTNYYTLPAIPRGPRVKYNGTWKNTVAYVKVNGVWKLAVPYVKYNGTWKIGGG